MKGKEKTKEAWQLSAVCGPELDPRPLKNWPKAHYLFVKSTATTAGRESNFIHCMLSNDIHL